MDPYVLIKLNGKEYKTKVIDDGGQQPVWNEELEIPFNTFEDSVHIACFDEDLIKDSCVGEEDFKVSDLINCKKWITLLY